MEFTAEQIKGRIRNVAKENNADARVLMRIFMMERFLERVSQSKYSDNFIIKGGILVTSMVGVSMRSTMDIDTTIRNINLSEEDAKRVVTEIAAIDLDDGIIFEVQDVMQIMDEMEYPGIRITMNALLEQTWTPLKIDISTNDAITPREIKYNYKLMLEDRSINLWTYNLETILAEKLQTILTRAALNTRMRDFYDVYILLKAYRDKLNAAILRMAFDATCAKRGTVNMMDTASQVLDNIAVDEGLKELWTAYRKKYSYAKDITYEEVIESVRIILNTIWDPDYTKLTKEEEASMLAAEASGFVNDDEIDWNKIGLN